ncbi:helix-turn-helix transcriptional regulator [Puniceibacterium confluentis]|uniref:helix-turn-helix transcriptional regulator n=1 Tax=Puniceibacterium confluentis TaxID=1958944 RepID=UPI00164793A0|nr:helix-turn-helix transcriptional regulator [Puniceibacterium confluentis]
MQQRPIAFEIWQDIISAIFSAALDGSKWEDVTELISRASGGIHVQLVSLDRSRHYQVFARCSSFDPDFLRTYDSYYCRINQRIGRIASLRPGDMITSDELFPFDQFRHTEIYNDWLKPQGDLSLGRGTVLYYDEDRLAFLAVDIPSSRADTVEPQWIQTMRLLAEPIRRALEINCVLDLRRLECLGFENGGTADAAVLAIGADRRLLWANPVGRQILERGDLLQLDVLGRVSAATNAGLRERLDLTAHATPGFDEAFRTTDVTSGTWSVRSTRFDPAAMKFSPLGPLGGSRGRCLLLVLQPADDSRVRTLLKTRYGLTDAEAAVVELLVEGLDTKEIATRRHASANTVRNQLKAALWKTDSHRQGDLVKLFLTLGSGARR